MRIRILALGAALAALSVLPMNAGPAPAQGSQVTQQLAPRAPSRAHWGWGWGGGWGGWGGWGGYGYPGYYYPW